jgi:hypothetical protein
MNKETRNHYLKLLGVFAVMFLIGTLYHQLFNNSASPTKKVKEEKEVEGGYCNYKSEDFPAIILDIDSSNVEDCDLQLYRPEDFNDTVIYSMKNNNSLKLETIHSEKLKVGDTIIYQQSHITEGSCNPFVERIVLEKFRKKNQ